MNADGALKWRFDISTFRLIGRDLITDRVTALFELIKNCYDANATEVLVRFENIQTNHPNSKIIIQDNGIGMSFSDIKDKWMVIGTSNKRRNKLTPDPMRRRCVGEKGIGRFAVDKLGDKVYIQTKPKNAEQWLEVEIDWSQYYKQAQDDEQIVLFTDIENQYKYWDAIDKTQHGTTLSIESIREPWSMADIERFISEASRLVSPFTNISYPLTIRVEAPEYNLNTIASQSIENTNLATINFNLSYDANTQKQDIATFNKETGKLEIEQCQIKSFGGIRMRVYYFDDTARRKYRKEFPNDQIDGVKIYRDGVITTPFAENESDSDKKRDVLGIDKRLWQNLFDRVSTREIIGFVDISKENNPQIIDATNRQDFVDNKEYRDLKEFIIIQLSVIEEYKKLKRREREKANRSTLEKAGEDIHSFISSVKSLSADNPSLKPSLEPVIQQAQMTSKAVRSAIKEKKEAEQEFERKESIYMSIMSLQDYAIHITHAVRTTLNKIRDRIEFFNLFYPNPEHEAIFKHYSKEMKREFISLNKVIDYMLSYSQSNLKPEDIELTQTLKEVIDEYANRFKTEHINTEFIAPESITLKSTNKVFFRDILQNLIDNSIKALKNAEQKQLRISLSTDKELIIKVSDTGNGIPQEKKQWVFGLYNTTTQESGGAGIGLYIVKTRVECLKGTVIVDNSEFGDIGTTIRINLPFK